MERMLLINSVLGYGSTGRIVLDIAREYERNGYEVKIAYGLKRKLPEDKRYSMEKYGVRIGNDMDVYYHALYTRMTDKHGLASKRATKAFLRWADSFNPSFLWIHNIHNYYINYELLFDWIKSRPGMRVKWTLHDCWAVTGHCSHFIFAKCNKWKEGCHNCPQLDQYPKAMKDNSVNNYLRKRIAFTGVSNMTLVTPSYWLKEIVQESYLSDYPVVVKHNEIDSDIFRPTSNNIRLNYGLQDKKIILGVASTWSERKGLSDFIELSKRLASTNLPFRVVLIGLSKEQICRLRIEAPAILALPHTSDVKELVQFYSAADYFVNPTYEDTFPTVNMEAEACGTAVITYDIGGCKETIKSPNSRVISPGVDSIMATIV